MNMPPGIKTGSTPEAGQCLAASASKDGRNLISVVLGAEKHCAVRRHHSGGSPSPRGKRLLQWGFSSPPKRFWTAPILEAPFPSRLPGRQLCRGPGIGGNRGDPPQRSGPGGFPGDARVQRREPGGPRGQGSDRGQGHGLQRRYGIRLSDLVAVDSVARSELLYRLDQVKRFFDQLWEKSCWSWYWCWRLCCRCAGCSSDAAADTAPAAGRYSGARRPPQAMTPVQEWGRVSRAPQFLFLS